MNNQTFYYELLCVDSTNVSKIKSADNLAYSIMSNSILLIDPTFDPQQRKVSDLQLTITIDRVDTKNSTDFAPQNSFRMSMSGEFNIVERSRIILINHIKKQDFQLIYVLTDEVSENIAQEIYPKINRVENRLRRYIIRFFATKLGADWWKQTADLDMQSKALRRKSNETFFGPTIDNRAYLIDFGELGEIIYTQSSGFISRDDIIKKILSLTLDSNSIERIKEEIQSNYTKYFKETFKEAGFQSKWKILEKIRHKVAHNNLFTIDDRNTALIISEQLIQIIENADRKVEELVFSQTEVAAIQDAIIEQNAIIENIVDTEQEQAQNWRDEVKNALQHLGGEADLEEIYNYISKNSTRELPESWKPIIRWTLQVNSADTSSFAGKHNIFKWIKKGRWALHPS